MSNFMDGIKSTLNNECNVSVTENGAVGFRTTGKALLDLNFAVASLRSASEHDISQRFTKAFFEDKLMAMKWLFYARDVRGGLGERRLFRACMVPLAKEFPEYVAPVVALVPEYGRWDDLWCLLDTPACDCVTGLVKGQLYDDTQNAAEGKPISLLAKWMPRQSLPLPACCGAADDRQEVGGNRLSACSLSCQPAVQQRFPPSRRGSPTCIPGCCGERRGQDQRFCPLPA